MSTAHTKFPRLLLITGLSMLLFFDRAAGQTVSNPDPETKQPKSRKAMAIERLSFLTSNLEMVQSEIAKIDELRAQKVDQQDSLGFSLDSFGDIIASLQTQRVELMIDLAGLEARRDALQNFAEAKINSDENKESLQLLQELLASSEIELHHFEQLAKQGSVASSVVADANRRFMETKVRLLEATNRNLAMDATQVGPPLMAVSLDRAEKQARLEKVEVLLSQLTSGRAQVRELDNLNLRYQQYQRQVDEIERAKSVAQNQLEYLESASNDELEADDQDR